MLQKPALEGVLGVFGDRYSLICDEVRVQMPLKILVHLFLSPACRGILRIEVSTVLCAFHAVDLIFELGARGDLRLLVVCEASLSVIFLITVLLLTFSTG